MRLEVYPNLTGMAGTQRTIAHMRRLVEAGKVDPDVVLRAHKIVKGIDRNDWMRLGNAIFRYVHDKIDYVRDPVGVEFVKSPAITLKTKTGDCDDQSVLFAALAESVGIKTRFKAIKADKRYPDEFSHVYSQAEIPGKGWVTADTIVPKARFGWEAKNFPSRTWPATNGLAGIDVNSNMANKLGDALLSAGSVGYDEEPDMDGGSSFGDAFGDDLIFGGGMWDQLPVLASDTDKISTIVDAPQDFWGGSTDTPAGPAMKSRMLSPGVGSMNGLQLGYKQDQNGEVWLGYYDGMGGWNPFKKIGRSISKSFKKLGGSISKGWKNLQKEATKIGNKLAKGVGLSTGETREKAGRKAVEAAWNTVWPTDGIQFSVALLERAQETLKAGNEGRLPKWSKGPPPTMQGIQVETWRCPYASGRGMGWVATAISVGSELLKGLGAAEDQKAAVKAIKKYVNAFPQDRLNKAVAEVTKAYVAAGGLLPGPKDRATPEWLKQFKANALKGKSTRHTGSIHHYMWTMMTGLESTLPGLTQARKLYEAAHKAFTKTEGGPTLNAAANVVRQAVQAGTIAKHEIAAALTITNKKAQGYTITPQEQELAKRIADGARTMQGAGKGVMVAVPAAAAAVGVATLFL